MMSAIDFFLMMAVAGIIAWFATKGKRRRRIVDEELPLRPGSRLNVLKDKRLQPQTAKKNAIPYFLVLDTETIDLLTEVDYTPPIKVLSYALLDKHFELIEWRFCHFYCADDGADKVDPFAIYERLRTLFDSAQMIVAHALGAHRKLIDHDMMSNGLQPLPWQSKSLFCTMEAGIAYLQRHQPDVYNIELLSLRSLYGSLYFHTPSLIIVQEDKPREDIIIAIACLQFLYPAIEGREN